eukprot:1800700-Ditylum_brightwellii.AAC.1
MECPDTFGMRNFNLVVKDQITNTLKEVSCIRDATGSILKRDFIKKETGIINEKIKDVTTGQEREKQVSEKKQNEILLL